MDSIKTISIPTLTKPANEGKRQRRAVDFIAVSDHVGNIRAEISKAKYILQDIIEDYLDPLCIAAEKQQRGAIIDKVLIDAHRLDMKAQILNDILAAMEGINDSFDYYIENHAGG